MTRTVRVLVAVMVATVGLWLVPQVGQAWDFCKDAPVPVSPRDGAAGLVTVKPAEVPADTPDPFTTPGVSIGEVYGYGWSWSNYDLGCGSNLLADPLAVNDTSQGNLLMGGADVLLALLGSLQVAASAGGFGWLADGLGRLSSALATVLFGADGSPGLWSLGLLVAGVVIVWMARRARFAAIARISVTILVSLAISVGLLASPQGASRVADELVTFAAKVSGTGLNLSVTDGPNRYGAYQVWLAGSFGTADSDVAKTYGPRLLAATHFSWSEVAKMDADPSLRAKLTAQKQADFKALAAEVKKADPTAYETFKGSGQSRVSIANMGLFSVFCMGLFGLIALGMIVVARIMMQALVLAAPIAAAVGIIPGRGHVLRQVWELFVAALIAVVKFTLASAVMAVLLQAAMTFGGSLNPLGMLLVLALTIVGLVLTHPFQAFKAMVPGLDPNRSYLREFAVQVTTTAITAATGGAAGAVFGTIAAEKIAESDDSERAPFRTWVTQLAMPPTMMPLVETSGPRLELNSPPPATGLVEPTPVGPSVPPRRALPMPPTLETQPEQEPTLPVKVPIRVVVEPDVVEPSGVFTLPLYAPAGAAHTDYVPIPHDGNELPLYIPRKAS
ncbi:MAG: hypothetical protein ACOH1Y_10085 [Propionicimonas sp.]